MLPKFITKITLNKDDDIGSFSLKCMHYQLKEVNKSKACINSIQRMNLF